jgi:ketosteroid isomerase-like protein
VAHLQRRWIYLVAIALIIGAAADRLFARIPWAATQHDSSPAMAGIERLHELDERVTLLNSAQALQQEWTDDAVRLEPGSPPDIGKRAIFKTDSRSFAQAPGAAFISYKPVIREVHVVGSWAFEWGLFTVGYRPGAGKPAQTLHGKFLRVLHREASGEWKFARIMAGVNSN